MAGKNLVIRDVVYSAVPGIDVPISGGGTARFVEPSDATISSAAQVRNGVKVINANGEVVTGSMAEKAAANYLPSTSDQTVAADQFLAGAQTIKAVTTTNLTPANIAAGVVVKVGCASDDDCVKTVTGTLTTPIISQDNVTKILSIS